MHCEIQIHSNRVTSGPFKGYVKPQPPKNDTYLGRVVTVLNVLNSVLPGMGIVSTAIDVRSDSSGNENFSNPSNGNKRRWSTDEGNHIRIESNGTVMTVSTWH